MRLLRDVLKICVGSHFLLDVLAELRKATISFVMSVRLVSLSVRM